MNTRLLKQLSYGVIFLTVFGLIAIGFYYIFLRSTPSCFDTTQNQDEEGIDCGGPCSTACISANLRPLEVVGTVDAFSPDGRILELLAKVQNPNSDVAAQNFSYTFRVTDTAHQVFEVPGVSYLYAGEIRYVERLERLPAGLDTATIAKTELLIDDLQWIADASFRRPRFRIQQQRTAPVGDVVQVSGVVVNDDTVPFQNVKVIAVLFDSLGNRVGVTETSIDVIQPNESRAFTVIHPGIASVNLAVTEVVVTTAR